MLLKSLRGLLEKGLWSRNRPILKKNNLVLEPCPIEVNKYQKNGGLLKNSVENHLLRDMVMLAMKDMACVE
jgi:hypothetical protein